jgi:hypothetical protein
LQGRSSRELWLSLIAILCITAIYLGMVNYLGKIPAASGLFGHLIGIVGFVLMLMTEILYSLRKRSRRARWGRMSTWLEFHIFTGIVGPYMVLLHTSWKFNGLAGITLLLTVIIVISGFIGRYIFTSIPRTADGIEVEAVQLEKQLERLETEIRARSASRTREIKRLVDEQKRLQRQVHNLANTRRLMSLWHTIHVPIGLALFTAAFIHSVAAFYYATLLK